MTTLSQAREAVYQRFNTHWGSTTPFQFDNQDLKLASGSVPWARVSVRQLSSSQETMGQTGSRRFRRNAKASIQIFTSVNKGTKTGDDLAQTARIIFEGTSFSGLDFNNTQVQETGPDGKWFQHVVEALFDYEEIK